MWEASPNGDGWKGQYMGQPSRTSHSSDLRKGRISLAGHIYFITKCASHTVGNALAVPECAELVISSLMCARDKGWWRILGFTIMPDHYHALIGLTGARLSSIMASVDKYTARRINERLRRQGSFWQDGFYEHLVRDRKDYDDILSYIHNNPVQAGLAQSADTWEYSTANERYAGHIDWEWVGPSMPRIRECKHRFTRDAIPPKYW